MSSARCNQALVNVQLILLLLGSGTIITWFSLHVKTGNYTQAIQPA
jgi:hypothetical protein